MSAAHTPGPGPWTALQVGRRWIAWRTDGRGGTETMSPTGIGRPSYFRSEQAVRTAIAKATGVTR